MAKSLHKASGKELLPAERVIRWCRIVFGWAILLFPPISQMDDSDSAVTRYYFLPLMPRLSTRTFVWPVTAFLMAMECLVVLCLTLIATWITRRLRTKQGIG